MESDVKKLSEDGQKKRKLSVTSNDGEDEKSNGNYFKELIIVIVVVMYPYRSNFKPDMHTYWSLVYLPLEV